MLQNCLVCVGGKHILVSQVLRDTGTRETCIRWYKNKVNAADPRVWGGPEILQTGFESRGQADYYPGKGCLALPSFPVNCVGKTSVCLLCVHMCSAAQSCLTLCDPTACGLPGSSVHGISKARIREWVAIQEIFPGDLCNPGMALMSLVSPALAGAIFTTGLPGKPFTLSQYLWHQTCASSPPPHQAILQQKLGVLNKEKKIIWRHSSSIRIKTSATDLKGVSGTWIPIQHFI